MRVCSFCHGGLDHTGGHETSARERAGNALEVDVFRCRACGRQYRHRVDERFSGDIHVWWQRENEGDDWALLEEARWPTFGPSGSR